MPPAAPMLPLDPLMPSNPPSPPSTGILLSRVVLLQVSMTCHQPLGQSNVLSDVPPTPHHPLFPLSAPWVEDICMAKSGTELGSH